MTLYLTLLPRLRTLSSEPYNFTMLLICEWTHSALAFGIRKEKEDYGEIGTLSRILLVASEWPKHPPFPVIQQNTRYSSPFHPLFPLPLSPVHALPVPLAGTIHGRERGQSRGYAFGVLCKADGEELGQSEIPLPDHSATPHVVLAD